MSLMAAPMTQPKSDSEHCKYRGIKIDTEIIDLVKAASLVLHVHAQEWASDVLNQAAAEVLNREPIIRRKPPIPKPKGGKRRGRPRKRPD